MDNSDTIDFMDKKTQMCPFGAYAKINEMGGVYLDKSTGFYIVTGYELVKRLARNNKILSNKSEVIGVRNEPWQDEVNAIYAERGVPIYDVLVSADPPEHNFQRSLVDKVFSPVRVNQMADYLRKVVDKYIASFINDGVVDFHTAISVMVPITVIADQLGVSNDPKDLANFKRWTDAVTRSSEPNISREDQIRYAHDVCDLQQFILDMAEKYRKNPADCMMSDLVHADVDGRRLTEAELVSMVIIILAAGHETTTNGLSNGMLRLISEPGLQARLRAEPGLMANFVEEVLRIDSPIQGLFRRALQDIDIDGFHIPKESILVLKWGGANHDPAKFSDPESFNMERENAIQHLAFGSGPHFCVGNQLARSELRLVFQRMLEETTDIRPANRPDYFERNPHYIVYGFSHLWLEFDKAANAHRS